MTGLVSRAARTIYKKELVDTLRDRRTVAAMLLVPMVAYPLTLLMTTETIAVSQRNAEERQIRVVATGSMPPATAAALAHGEGLRVVSATAAFDRATTATSTLDQRARYMLDAEEADVLVAGTGSAAALLGDRGTARLLLYFDGTKTYAEAYADRVEGVLSHHAAEVRDRRMQALGLPASIARPISISRRSIATETEVGSQIASVSLPALILLFIAISSFYPAVDLTAGEKERKTLATLLTAPIRPLDIVAGKYLAVVTVGTLAGLLNVVVLSLTLLRAVAGRPDTRALSFTIPFGSIFAILPLVVLVAAPIGALMLLVAALARSFRDASYLLTPVLLLSVTPAALTALPGLELTPVTAAIPLANAALLMKAMLLGRATVSLALVVVVASLVFTALVLLLCARTFSDERVLFSTEGRRVDVRTLLRTPPPVGTSTALTFAGIVFALNYYGGLAGEGWPPQYAVAFTQLIAHVLPSLLLARWLRGSISPRTLLRWRPPRPLDLASGLVLGASAWLGLGLPGAWLVSYLIPGQSEAARAFASALGIDHLGLGAEVLFFAVIPAVAEEIAFRGAILSLLESGGLGGPRAALVMQALLFGAMHGSVFRLLPTGLLGLALGVVARRSGSLVPGIIAHALTNAILLAVDAGGGGGWAERLTTPTPLALIGVLGVLLALALDRVALTSRNGHP